MTVPTGDIGRVVASQSLCLDNNILQYFIHSMTDMDVTICVWGAVMQDKGLVTFRLHVTDLLIPIIRYPRRHHVRLTFRQVSTHRELSFRKIQRMFIISH